MDEQEEKLPKGSIIVEPPVEFQTIVDSIVRGETNLSYSALGQFAESPRDFVAYKMQKREATPAMVYGKMLHCLVLEPDDFMNRYFVLDNTKKLEEIGGAKPTATKAYKEWVEMMKGVNEGKEMTSQADYNIAKQIADQVLKNGPASKVLQLCPEREKKCEWNYGPYKWHGFKDGTGQHATFDLKSCADANPKKFLYDLIKMGYYRQGAMYNVSDEQPFKDYYIIAVDKTGGVSVHQLSKNLLTRGHKEYKYYTEKFSECVLRNAWNQSYEFFADRFDGIYTADRPW